MSGNTVLTSDLIRVASAFATDRLLALRLATAIRFEGEHPMASAATAQVNPCSWRAECMAL